MDILAEAEVSTTIRVIPKEPRIGFLSKMKNGEMVQHSIRTSWQDSMVDVDQVAFKPLKGRLNPTWQTHSQLSARQP